MQWLRHIVLFRVAYPSAAARCRALAHDTAFSHLVSGVPVPREVANPGGMTFAYLFFNLRDLRTNKT